MLKSQKCLPLLATAFVLCGLSHLAHAQQLAASHGKQLTAMTRLQGMVGHWQGHGWIKFGARRFEFESSEIFTAKAGGLAIMVEGLHHARTPDGKKQIVHDAAAMITFDATANRYRFATQLATGRAGTYQARFTQDGDFQWTIPDTPAGKMIYTISFNEDGEYREIGELVSASGEREKFFEMKLTKVKAKIEEGYGRD